MPDKLLQVFLCESDRYLGKPLHEAIVEVCREEAMAGATVLRGVEGFGEGIAAIRKHPLTVMIIDSEEKIDAFVPVLQAMLTSGTITVSEVRMRRVTVPPPVP